MSLRRLLTRLETAVVHPLREGRMEDRGAILILAALVMSVLIVAVAMTVDIGRETVTHRDLRTIADQAANDGLAAMNDTAAQGSGGFNQTTTNDAAAESALLSAEKNHFTPGATYATSGGPNTLVVETGIWIPMTGTPSGATTTTTPAAPFQVLCSYTFTAGTAFTLTDDTTPRSCNTSGANAVRVTATTVENWAFQPGSQSVTAQAVAADAGETQLQIGTFAGRIGPGNCVPPSLNINGTVVSAPGNFTDVCTQIMNVALGGVNLTAAGYQGLANATMTIPQLEAAFNAGSPSQLMATSVTLPQLAQAEANALDSSGNTSAGASMQAIATALAAAYSNTGTNGPTTTLGVGVSTTIQTSTTISGTTANLIPLAPITGTVSGGLGNGSAADAGTAVNALSMLDAGFETYLANTQNTIDIPNVNLGLYDLSGNPLITADIKMSAIEGPQIGPAAPACTLGKSSSTGSWTPPPTGAPCAHAESAQVRFQVTLNFEPVSQLGVGTLALQIPLFIKAADGHAWVYNNGILCSGPNDPHAFVGYDATTGAANLAVGQVNNLDGSDPLGNITSTVSGTVGLSLPGTSWPITVPVSGINSTIVGANAESQWTDDTSHAFSQTSPYVRSDPQTVQAGSATPPAVSTVNAAVVQIDGNLASALPSPLVSAIEGLPTGNTLNPALVSTLVSSAITNVNLGFGALVGALIQPLSSIAQVGIGGADIADIGIKNTATGIWGTVCSVPTLVQ